MTAENTTMTPDRIKSHLASHYGSLERFATIANKVIFTPGVKDMADLCKAYWLVDAIMSHIVFNKQFHAEMNKDTRLKDLQFWKLTVADGKATLICQADSDVKPAVTQEIPYTDFPLKEMVIWAGFDGTQWTLYLPSEH